MEMTSVNTTTQQIVNEINEYLDTAPKIEDLKTKAYKINEVFELSKDFSNMVNLNTSLYLLIQKAERWQSLIKDTISRMSKNSSIERNQVAILEANKKRVEMIAQPLYIQKEAYNIILRYYDRAMKV